MSGLFVGMSIVSEGHHNWRLFVLTHNQNWMYTKTVFGWWVTNTRWLVIDGLGTFEMSPSIAAMSRFCWAYLFQFGWCDNVFVMRLSDIVSVGFFFFFKQKVLNLIKTGLQVNPMFLHLNYLFTPKWSRLLLSKNNLGLLLASFFFFFQISKPVFIFLFMANPVAIILRLQLLLSSLQQPSMSLSCFPRESFVLRLDRLNTTAVDCI